MRLSFKRKLLILVLSFALANIAFYSIINFHQYRVFGKELSKIDKFFTKKDDKKVFAKSAIKDVKIFSGDNDDMSGAFCETEINFCFPDKLLIYSPKLKGNFPQILNNILPIRGSPLS